VANTTQETGITRLDRAHGGPDQLVEHRLEDAGPFDDRPGCADEEDEKMTDPASAIPWGSRPAR
jgi:hypothetical protein